MSAEIIPLHPRPFVGPVAVELSSPGTQEGRPFYIVDYIEADGGRTAMWDGHDLVEARRALADCAVPRVPLYDRTAMLGQAGSAP